MSQNLNHDLLTSKLTALTEVAEVLAAQLELPELLQSVIDKIIDILDPAEFGIILLWNQTRGVFEVQAATAKDMPDLEAVFKIGLLEGESITGRVFAEQKAQLLSTPDVVAEAMSDISSNTAAIMNHIYGDGKLPLSVITAPISAGEQKYGVLVLETLRGQSFFTQGDISFVQTLADLIGLEIDRARLDTITAAIRESNETDRLRAELLATFSHELRTPLATIKGYSTALLLEDIEWPEDKRREFLQLVDEECDNLEGMISDILDANRLKCPCPHMQRYFGVFDAFSCQVVQQLLVKMKGSCWCSNRTDVFGKNSLVIFVILRIRGPL